MRVDNGHKQAKRVSYELATGEKVGYHIRITNSCGHKYCINPKHLVLIERNSEKKLLQTVRKLENGCWECIESNNSLRKGWFNMGKGGVRIRRAVYEAVKGRKVKKGVYLLTTCKNSKCVNPEHMRFASKK